LEYRIAVLTQIYNVHSDILDYIASDDCTNKDGEAMNDPIKLIESVGFPIALILILFTNKIFSESTQAIRELTIAIKVSNNRDN
jgi:hypothetical protein